MRLRPYPAWLRRRLTPSPAWSRTGQWFAVTVASRGGTWCLYDESDWLWLKSQIADGS